MSAPEPPQFVDTNVLVYAHDISAGSKYTRARDLLTELWSQGNGCLSVQVLQEFYVTVTQKVARPLDSPSAAQVIADLSEWTVHRPSAQDVLDAIGLQRRYGIAFWDAMIVQSALMLRCLTLWSEDLNPGQSYDSLKVRNPFAA